MTASDSQTTARVPDATLLSQLGATALRRRPYEYATSSALEQLDVEWPDGSSACLILKDLHRDQLIGAARDSKPLFLFEPLREITTYRALLAPHGFGTTLRACGADWLAVDKAPGIELWQVGDLEVWHAVARWLGEFHRAFAGRPDDLARRNPYLLDYRADLALTWLERAEAALRVATDARAHELLAKAPTARDCLTRLAELPSTLVHGEFYPSNVLVASGETADQTVGIWPIDWEMSSIGPGLLDLAALVGGWAPDIQASLIATYGTVDRNDLERCRLSLALQWIGWSPGWQPPDEHAHDWIGEALEILERLT